MKQVQAFLMSTAVVMGLTACCCNLGNQRAPIINPGGGVNQGGGNVNEGADADPAEQAAVQFVTGNQGAVTKNITKVVEVRLQFDKINDDQLKTFASLSRLRKLDIMSSPKVSGAGLKALAGLNEFAELNVFNCGLTDDGMKDLATLTRLKVLVAGQNRKVTDAGWSELGKLTELVELNLSDNVFATATLLAVAKNCKQLQKLEIGNTGPGTNDVGLAEVAKLPNLKELKIYGTRVTNTGLAALTKTPNLEVLYVSFSDINDQSAKLFAQCKNLRTLSIFATRMTDKGLEDLGTLPNLKELKLNANNGITAEAKNAFMKAHPQIKVD
jgi:Leucine-rich repeat (LRR) protein